MGLAGTEITKQAADLVLANDDFTTIVAAVEEGRQVFDNILKFIVYLLSCNGAEIFLMLICACAGIELPFTTIMILWANIIGTCIRFCVGVDIVALPFLPSGMIVYLTQCIYTKKKKKQSADIPPAMALGLEPAEKDLMRRKPRNPNAGVLTRVTWTMVGLQSGLMALMTFGVYTIALYIEKINEADSRSLVSLHAPHLPSAPPRLPLPYHQRVRLPDRILYQLVDDLCRRSVFPRHAHWCLRNRHIRLVDPHVGPVVRLVQDRHMLRRADCFQRRREMGCEEEALGVLEDV
ncbi:hypothetical protein BC938DRAFT_473830 [Jimgerdemannia flammicorona]|uniref:Cation-transporting P-type ATPase C-terminal domain-containing protein n=1 Tax=Jimgerdemannia flammicorona TaxID=994334 RepID=A0A433QT03_9FUNG|nr:hypothetical protein BC938DRAFT_473830 [Jimgerdemannia flammicorona]